MTNKKKSAGVIGAGISGLTTAYALQKQGITVRVYEKNSEPGGAIRSERKEGWLVEEGPNTLMVKSQLIWNLLQELDLADDLVEANSEAKRRFIVRNDQPVALPDSFGSFLTSPLLSAGAKLRLLKEPFAAPSATDDESIASFIRRRLGQQPLDYGVNPFISGIYAGDPGKLSIKHTLSSLWQAEQQHGSLLKGMIKKKNKRAPAKKSLLSFSGGIQMLPKALAQALNHPVQTSCEIHAASRSGDSSGWKIKGMHNHQAFQAEHDILISTLPAYILPSLFESDRFNLLSKIHYVPLSVMALGFRDGQIGHPLNGFGMLIPEVEKYSALGMLFSSTLFPGRAPNRHHLLTCFIGGARQPHLARKAKAELLELLLPELSHLLAIDGTPVFTHHTFWQKAIPQYEVGFSRYLSAMDSLEERNPGFLIGGNFRRGVSVPDCIASGFKTAEKAAHYLTNAAE